MTIVDHVPFVPHWAIALGQWAGIIVGVLTLIVVATAVVASLKKWITAELDGHFEKNDEVHAELGDKIDGMKERVDYHLPAKSHGGRPISERMYRLELVHEIHDTVRTEDLGPSDTT